MFFALGAISMLVVVAIVLNIVAKEMPDMKASNVWIKTIQIRDAVDGEKWVATVKYAGTEISRDDGDEEKAIAKAIAALGIKLLGPVAP